MHSGSNVTPEANIVNKKHDILRIFYILRVKYGIKIHNMSRFYL